MPADGKLVEVKCDAPEAVPCGMQVNSRRFAGATGYRKRWGQPSFQYRHVEAISSRRTEFQLDMAFGFHSATIIPLSSPQQIKCQSHELERRRLVAAPVSYPRCAQQWEGTLQGTFRKLLKLRVPDAQKAVSILWTPPPAACNFPNPHVRMRLWRNA